MDAGACTDPSPAAPGREPAPDGWAGLAAGVPLPDPCSPAELRELVWGGGGPDPEESERTLAQLSRAAGALDLSIGDGLAALCLGERLISLGFSCLRDYAREALGMGERKAQTLAHLSRELRARPLLQAALRAGEVRIRAAETVLPVAVGEAEPAWVERARRETVRALAEAVREARERADPAEDEDWGRFRVHLSASDREVVDEALAVAGKVLPGSPRAERLGALAMEYLGEHPQEAGDDGPRGLGGSFRPAPVPRADREAQLEAETDRWSSLARVLGYQAPDPGFDQLSSPVELDQRLRALARARDAWDRLLGYGALVVRRSGLWRQAGFASFQHYCTERLGLSARTVEQRAALEQRLWGSRALRDARDAGLSYEKLRALAQLPERELAAAVPRAQAMTCIALRRDVEERTEAQLRAARALTARMPSRVALDLAAAFRAVRAVAGALLPDGKCLVLLARHFLETWKPLVKRARTRAQKVRERDGGRCQVPGCSLRAPDSHHIVFRAHGGTDDPENEVALCRCHHLRGIHGGHLRVRGRAPGELRWELGGRGWAAVPQVRLISREEAGVVL
jgi:hypothetical protein